MASEPVDLPPDAKARSFDGPEAIPITGTTVAAFIGRTERGPLHKAISIASFDEFRRVFGGSCPFSFVPEAVQHYFLHGGAKAVVVRIANRAARALLEIPCGTESWRLQAQQPGSREFLRVSIDYDRVERDLERFNLVVQRLSRLGSQLVDDQELYPALSLDPTDRNYVADALQTRSSFGPRVRCRSCRPDATRARRPGDAIPYLETRVGGSDGEELSDYDIIGSNDEGTGLFALDRCPRIDLLCIPSPPGARSRQHDVRRSHALLRAAPRPVGLGSALVELFPGCRGLVGAKHRANEPERRHVLSAGAPQSGKCALPERDAGVRRRRGHTGRRRQARRLAQTAVDRYRLERPARAARRPRCEAGLAAQSRGRQCAGSLAGRRRGPARQRELRGRESGVRDCGNVWIRSALRRSSCARSRSTRAGF